MVDVKLMALQAGTFGRRFSSFVAPLTFVVSPSAPALLVGWLLAVSTDAGAMLTAVIGVAADPPRAARHVHAATCSRRWGPGSPSPGCCWTLLGIVVLWRHRRGDTHEPDHATHGHDHGGERVAWLLLAPVLAILLIAPGARSAPSPSAAPDRRSA